VHGRFYSCLNFALFERARVKHTHHRLASPAHGRPGTKAAQVHHDPPLLFDLAADPAEASPLPPAAHQDILQRITALLKDKLANISSWVAPHTSFAHPVHVVRTFLLRACFALCRL